MKNMKWMLVTVAAVGLMALSSQAQWNIPADPKARQEYVAKLIATLKSSDAPLNERFGACRELAVIGTKDAVPALAALLPDEKMSHMARYGLEPIPDPSVDDALRAALGKVKGKLLVGVINSIGVRRDAKAVDPLTPLLHDSDAEVASAAAVTLGRIGIAAAAKVLEQALPNAPAAVLPAVCEGCLLCVESALAQGKRDDAVALADRVRASQAPHHVRMAATRAAILARGADGIPLLVEQLKSDDAGMFAVALRATYEMTGSELTKALAADLAKLPAEKQELLLHTLGVRRDTAAVPAVLAEVKSGPVKTRVAAIQALTHIGSPAALPTLVELAAGSDAEVATAAQGSLASFRSNKADGAIAGMLKSKDAKARRIGIELLGQRQAVGSMTALVKALEDAEEQNRITAIGVVGDLGGATQQSVLLGILTKASSPREMQAAETALAAISSRQTNADASAEKLVASFGQAQADAKRSLLRVLRAVGGPKALQAVRAATADNDPAIKDTAVRVLCDWGRAEAAPELLALSKSSPNPTYKVLALRGYIRTIGDKDLAADKRQAMCNEAATLIQRDEEKKLLLGALSNADDAKSLAVALPYLDNEATKEEASAAVVGISERLVAQNPTVVADAMKKVVKATKDAEVLKRARRVLNQTRPKPAGK